MAVTGESFLTSEKGEPDFSSPQRTRWLTVIKCLYSSKISLWIKSWAPKLKDGSFYYLHGYILILNVQICVLYLCREKENQIGLFLFLLLRIPIVEESFTVWLTYHRDQNTRWGFEEEIVNLDRTVLAPNQTCWGNTNAFSLHTQCHFLHTSLPYIF